MKKPYPLFRSAMLQSESSGNYRAENRFGFLGGYQFGMPRLADFRLAWITPDGRYEWSFPYSREIFLGSPILQDAIFDLHVKQLSLRITKQLSKATSYDLSGLVAIGHLLGFGGVRDHLNGVIGRDANGTTSKTYYDKFLGFELP